MSNLRIPLLAAFLIYGVLPARASEGLRSLDKSLKKPAKQFAKRVTGNVCVLDLTESADPRVSSEFGQAVADLFSSALNQRRNKKFKVVERRELVKIMQDSLVFGDHPDAIDKLRKAAGMNVLVSGTYASDGKTVSVILRATDAGTGALLESATVLLDDSPGLQKMAAHKYGQPEKAAAAPEGGDLLEVEAGVFFEGGDGKLYPVREGMVLTSKDNYSVYIHPKEDVHLYAYQVDSTEKAFKLFPEKDAATQVKGGSTHWLPGDRDYYFLDENPGREEIYLFATRQPSPELEKIKEATLGDLQAAIRTMGVGGVRGSAVPKKVTGTKKNPMDLILQRLASRGDFYYRLSFIHQQ